jgi:hypothetical protein
MKHFKINTKRDELVPDLECYQMDLKGVVDKAIASGSIDEDFKLGPSWGKFIANPIKSQGFFTKMLESLFLGQHSLDELNVDLQTEKYEDNSIRVAMMFLPANTTNIAMEKIGSIAGHCLKGYEIITLCGCMKHNGRKITNRIAERVTKEIVSQNKPILILASKMAQRSFSIPEITELYLAYDKGEMASTHQRISRTLTPNEIDKIGRVFSLSFDPNRDDKFDAMIVETALNYKKRKNLKSLHEAMREVLQTIDIFSCTPNGALKINIDDYLKKALERKSISRVLGKIVNFKDVPDEVVEALANGNNDYFKAETQEAAKMGKIKDFKKKKNKSATPKTKAEEKLIAKAKEVIVTILENLDIVILGTNSKDINEAIEKIKTNTEYQECITEEFNVPIEVIEYIFKHDIIKKDWIELLHNY